MKSFRMLTFLGGGTAMMAALVGAAGARAQSATAQTRQAYPRAKRCH